MKRETMFWLACFVFATFYLSWRAIEVGIGSQYVRTVDGRVEPATLGDRLAGTAEFSPAHTIGIWTAAILTLAVFSFLYRDNFVYKMAESIFVGVSAAYWMVVAFWDVMVPNMLGKLWPQLVQSWAIPQALPDQEPMWYMNFLPLVLGIMLIWQLAPRGGWIAVWPLAFIIGAFAGLRLVAYFEADFINQIRSSIASVAVRKGEGWNIERSLEKFTLLAGTLACLTYFFFSVEHKGVFGKVSRVGIWVLMITFGAGFGYTVMGRIALLAIRLEFLFDDWLWLIDPYKKRIGL